ncbi:MAG: inositol monophosphatase family protein [Gemmatimonadota bacterium]
MTSESDLLATALRAAEAAATVHRRYAGKLRGESVQRKGRADFVSRVDLEAQHAALSVIRERHPEHRILSEEDDGETGPSTPAASHAEGPIWIVDPLDGTTNFLHDHPAYAASVGVWTGGDAVAGAVIAEATEERWWALRGEGAFRNGTRIRTSPLRDLSTALIGTGFPFKHPEQLPGYLKDFARVLLSTAGIRRGGAAALDLCYLAQGSLDVFWEGTLAPWDIAAGVVILREAGGVATRRGGGQIAADESGSVVAANSPELLEAMHALLGDR